METPYLIIGAGGHALSVAEAAAALGLLVEGCVAPEVSASILTHLPRLGEDPDELKLPPGTQLLNGIGSAGPIGRRRSIYLSLGAKGYRFGRLIHPAAHIASLGVTLGKGVQVLAGSLINAGAVLGDNVLVNTGAIVEHGCQVGSHCHISSGATLCGDCRLAESVHIGAGATVIQGIDIGFGAVIAAGAVVTKDVEPLTLVSGVPAHRQRIIDEQELA